MRWLLYFGIFLQLDSVHGTTYFSCPREPFQYDFDELRASLALPSPHPIDPNEVNIRSLSPSRLRTLQLEKLSDQDLKFIFEVVSVRPNGKLLYRIGKEVLARESMKDHLDMVEVHERLADLSPTSDETLEHLSAARDLAVSEGESPATWLISELDVRIQRGESDAVQRPCGNGSENLECLCGSDDGIYRAGLSAGTQGRP